MDGVHIESNEDDTSTDEEGDTDGEDQFSGDDPSPEYNALNHLQDEAFNFQVNNLFAHMGLKMKIHELGGGGV